MPVLPEVGSTMVPPGFSFPEASRPSIIDTPMRSLTLESGLKNSSLRKTSALAPAASAIRPRRTIGVLPMVWAMLS